MNPDNVNIGTGYDGVYNTETNNTTEPDENKDERQNVPNDDEETGNDAMTETGKVELSIHQKEMIEANTAPPNSGINNADKSPHGSTCNGHENSETKKEDMLNHLDDSQRHSSTQSENTDIDETKVAEKEDRQEPSWKVVDVELDEKKDKPRLTWNVLKTIFLVLVWVCLGLCGEITGPTLLDLKLRTNSNYESVSSGVSGRSAGFFVGSALGGVLVDKFGLYCDIMVALGLDGEALTTVAIPWMPNTDLIFLMTFLQGTMEGIINISGQKLILEMWLEKAAGPLHLLHGGFGIGSFIIPLIANPFLAVTKEISENMTENENVTLIPGVTMTTRIPTTTEVVVKASRMEYAYLIASAITVLVSIVFFGYHLAGGKNRRKQKQNQYESDLEMSNTRVLSFKEMINPATCAGGRLFYGIQIFVFVFLYFTQAAGGERVCGKFVRAYSIKHLGFSESDGSYINTVFWIAFAVGRVLGLLTARFIPIRILVLLESGGCLIMSILLVIFGEKSTALWILMPAIGFFIAPLFPSGVGWANYHIKMTGVAITFFMLGGSVGGVVYMRLTGYLFDHYGYRPFLYNLLGFGIASFVISAIMDIVGAQHGSRFEQEKEEQAETINVSQKEVKNHTMENKGYMPE